MLRWFQKSRRPEILVFLWASSALQSTLNLQVLLTEEAGICAGWCLRSGTAFCPETAASFSWQSPEIVWEHHWVLAILPVWIGKGTLDKVSLTASNWELYDTHVELCWIPGVLGRCYHVRPGHTDNGFGARWSWVGFLPLQRPSMTISRYGDFRNSFL